MNRRSFIKALAAIGAAVIIPIRAASVTIGALINVKWYGAKGDGSHDDATAIRAAMDEATRTGRTVYFPSGHYRL